MKQQLLFYLSFICIFSSCQYSTADDYLFEGKKSYKKQDISEAIEYFNKAIKKDPKLVKAYVERGKAYFNTGQFELSEQDYTTAISLDSTIADAYYSRGRIYQFQNNMQKACVDWRKAAEYNYPLIEEHLKMCRGYN